MSYQVIARKWRPQTFADVVGQQHVTRTLANAIRVGRVAHAYIFSGARGVGKTTTARILAKALNCVKGPTHRTLQSNATPAVKSPPAIRSTSSKSTPPPTAASTRSANCARWSVTRPPAAATKW